MKYPSGCAKFDDLYLTIKSDLLCMTRDERYLDKEKERKERRE